MGEKGAPGGPDGDLAMRRSVDLFSALSDPDAMSVVKATSQLCALRTSHEALRDASSAQIPLAHTNTTMAFARVKDSSGAAAIVAFNCEGQPARMTLPVSENINGVGDGTEFYEPLAGDASFTVSGGSLTLELPPNGYRVLIRA